MGASHREFESLHPDQSLKGIIIMDLTSEMLVVLHNLALERIGWRRYFSRWYISDEPLRNDAARILRAVGYKAMFPVGTKYVGY